MAIVAHGLGQPEDGALVAGGLGIAESDPNALRAVLSGSGTLTASLANGTPQPEPPRRSGQAARYRPFVYPKPAPSPAAIPAPMVAHLSGSSALQSSLNFVIDPDYVATELAQWLLLDLV